MASDLLQDVWSGAEMALRREFGDELYQRWLQGLTVLHVVDAGLPAIDVGAGGSDTDSSTRQLKLGVANVWIQEWIETKYLGRVQGVLSELAGGPIEVRLAIDPELYARHRAAQQEVFPPPGASAQADEVSAKATEEVAGPVDPKAASQTADLSSSRPRVRRREELPRLDELVEGPCNQLALQAARRVLEGPGELFNPLVVHGPSGVGKSHLIRALHGELVRARRPRVDGPVSQRIRARSITAERFAQHFAASAQDRTLRKFRDTYRTLDLLVIDDVQSLASKTKSQRELLYTVEALVDSGRQVVISTDRPPQRLDDLEPGLVNRLLGGLVTRLERPDFATRWKIARRHASRLAVTREESISWGADRRSGARRWRGSLQESVLEFLAENLSGGIHELVGAVLRLDVHGRILGRSPRVSEAREVLSDILSERRRRIDLDRIRAVVADHFGWTEDELISRDRRRAVACARQCGMFLACRYTQLSLREIGKYFGDRDPTTVRFAERKIAELLRVREDASPARDVLAIIDRLED